MTFPNGDSLIEYFKGNLNSLNSTFPKSIVILPTRPSAASSSTSISTILPANGGFGGSLSDLCGLIDSYTTLQNAQIVSTECYTEPIALGIVHRLLIVELERKGKKNIWIRLDRRREKLAGSMKFFLDRGTCRANDTVSHC